MSFNIINPIPNMDEARAIKGLYPSYPIDFEHSLYNDPLVSTMDYDVAGLSYYSQPNNATGDPVPGVLPDIYVRRRTAEKLAATNEFLITHDGLAEIFGERIELFVRDGFRLPQLQQFLHDVLIPRLISEQNPDWSEEEVAAMVSRRVGLPKFTETAMPPHFTGGAVDLSLRGVDSKKNLDLGQGKARIGEARVMPEYLEEFSLEELATQGLELALKARRVLYNTMTSAEVGGVAMASHPEEVWHYSLYDQMWALLTNQPVAFYGIPPHIPAELKMDSVI